MKPPESPSALDPLEGSPSSIERVTPSTPKKGPHSSPPPRPRRRSRGIWLVLLALAGMGAYFLWPKLTGKTSGSAPPAAASKGGRGPQVTPVDAARARKGDIGVYFDGLGSVTPIYTVTVKSRVDGELMKVRYKEGDIVRQGDLLV